MQTMGSTKIILLTLCIGSIALLMSPSIGVAEELSSSGTVSANTLIKRSSENCETGLLNKCAEGEACFVNIEIKGEAAHSLYNSLRQNGIKSDDATGEYVGTKTDAMTCYESGGNYTCVIGYSSATNGLVHASGCEYE